MNVTGPGPCPSGWGHALVGCPQDVCVHGPQDFKRARVKLAQRKDFGVGLES